MVFFTQSWIFLENGLQNDIERTRCTFVCKLFHLSRIIQWHSLTAFIMILQGYLKFSNIFLRLIQKVNIYFTYLNKYQIFILSIFKLNIWFSACVNHCHKGVLTHPALAWIGLYKYNTCIWNLILKGCLFPFPVTWTASCYNDCLLIY